MLYHIANPDHLHSSEFRAVQRSFEYYDIIVAVEEDERVLVVTQLSSPYLLYSQLVHLPFKQISLLSERVLVDCDDLFVAQDSKCGVGDVLESASD